jgi:hypothetical protein
MPERRRRRHQKYQTLFSMLSMRVDLLPMPQELVLDLLALLVQKYKY